MQRQRSTSTATVRRKLRFEGLEPRAMLTGLVTATNEGGLLTITGDDAANSILVHQTASNSGEGTISVQIQGIATKINNLDTGITGNSATFTGVTDISIAMNGGRDSLTMSNTTIPNSLAIDMGDGNDVLTMTNVHEQLIGGELSSGLVRASAIHTTAKPHISGDASITLGAGNDVAVLTNVTSAGDLNFDAGDGRDIVVLTRVGAGSPGSANTLSVDMGTGNLDTLVVSSSSADNANFSSEGTTSILNFHHLRNNFVSEFDTGFRIVV